MIRLSKHAQEPVDKRNIAFEWVERTLAAPDFARPDPNDPSLTRSFKVIGEGAEKFCGLSIALTATTFSLLPSISIGCETMMRTSYDPDADAMFVWFGPEGAESAETEEVAPGIILDFDDRGEVVGIEILYVSRRTAKPKAAA